MEYSGFFNANFDAESGTYDREYSANDFAAFFSSFENNNENILNIRLYLLFQNTLIKLFSTVFKPAFP